MASFAGMAELHHTSVLFVCLGNICRSPLAEGVFRHLVEERDLQDHFTIDSAGTGSWHVGDPPDRRSIEVAARHGIQLTGRGRQIRPSDLHDFDYVIAMDRENFRNLHALGGEDSHATLSLLRDDDPSPEDGEVPDPYYGGVDGFDLVYDLILRSCRVLLDRILEERAH